MRNYNILSRNLSFCYNLQSWPYISFLKKLFLFLLSSLLIMLFLLLGGANNFSWADQEPQSIATTDHIKELIYSPNAIHKYTGFFGFPSSIVFQEGEVIDSVVSGNQSWDMQPRGNRLFLKPIQDNPQTNVTIITNKRVYQFQFYGEEAKGMDDPRLAYEVRFKYPDADNIEIANNNSDNLMFAGPDISNKPYLNFNYKISGADGIAPLKVFDDGQFTYLQFRDVNAELPAIFLVDSEGYEALINYHVSGRYIVVERVAARFTLRNGSDYVCLFNENMKYQKKRTRKTGLFQ